MKQSVYSVASLVHYIKDTLDNDLNIQSILIKGEISNFTNHRSGHWYFTLKDKKAKISCVMFASFASRCKTLPKEGMEVIVSGSVSVYEPYGNIQLNVKSLSIDGLGELYLQLEEVKKKLNREGLFDPAHKKPLPQYPFDIGVVTAKSGAAVQDILTTISRRWPLANVTVYYTLVQGIQAAPDIIKSLRKADEAGHEVILLSRGGGAIEDLWCFNDEAVARCVYDMKTVIVTGVGHEIDTTLVDYVSDARAPTPTGAAELITPDIMETTALVYTYRKRLTQDINARIQLAKRQLAPIKQHRYLQDPMRFIQQEQMKLAMHVKELGVVEHHLRQLQTQLRQHSAKLALLAERTNTREARMLYEKKEALNQSMDHYTTAMKQQMKEKIQLLDAFSPLKILSRGYHITYHDHHLVKSVKDVEVEDDIKLRMQDGYLHARVEKKETW